MKSAIMLGHNICKTQVMVTAAGAYGRGQHVRDCIELRSRQWKMYNKEAIELWVAVFSGNDTLT